MNFNAPSLARLHLKKKEAANLQPLLFILTTNTI